MLNLEKKLNSLSRRVRAAEMKYAISRRTEYDIQSKLTWMIDSLLADRVPITIEVEDSAPSNKKLVKLLRKHLRGGELKPGQLEKLGNLATICAPISRLDDFITSLEMTTKLEHNCFLKYFKKQEWVWLH